MSRAEPDEELCQRYAQFASHMVRWQFKVIYWTMFITNLFVLFLASWVFTKGQEAAERLKDDPKMRSKKIRMFMLLCFGCIVVSTVIVVMEVYALMALQFCDGEDLISLYWSTWTMIQVGALIAMVGIILAMFHTLTNSTHPPWALALGTPVLVIAGFLHLFHIGTKTKLEKIRASISVPGSADANLGPRISQANTIQAPEEDEEDGEVGGEAEGQVEGEVIGISVDGGPIVRFTRPVPRLALSSNMTLLGLDESRRPIVTYARDSVQFISDSEKGAQKPTGAGRA